MAEHEWAAPDLDRLRRRESAAFASLVASYQPLVMSLGQSMGLSGMDLEDGTSDVFDRVYRSLPGFAGRAPLRTWIYRIAVRTLSRYRRRLRRRQHLELPEDMMDPGASSPPQRAAEAETSRRLWLAVGRLGARSAAAVELYYRQGWSLDAIAEALGCPVGTVKTLLYRAREQLREALADQEER